MAREDELWHLVEARREDGLSTMFRIRDLAPQPERPRIFVVEIPYPVTELSRLPDAAAYRRLGQFEEQWLAPACATLGWTFVASKTDDGSCFLYLYGAGAPAALIERLSPFDPDLGFFDEHDPTWDEYAALRELIEQANALPPRPAPLAEPVAPRPGRAARAPRTPRPTASPKRQKPVRPTKKAAPRRRG